MKIRILGAGPAGLYFAALMKRFDPSHDIAIIDRSPRDATWGFGVVFSDRALEFLRGDDEALYRYLTPHLESWPDITIVHNDTTIPIAGNGFASIGRLELLTLLYGTVVVILTRTLADRLHASPRATRALNRLAGSVLMCFGAKLALSR